MKEYVSTDFTRHVEATEIEPLRKQNEESKTLFSGKEYRGGGIAINTHLKGRVI